MALPDELFCEILVETFDSGPISGRRGTIHVRAVAGQGIDTNLVIECNREMRDLFPLKTLFLISAKLTDRKGGGQYLKSPPPRKYSDVTKEQAKSFLRNLR